MPTVISVEHLSKTYRLGQIGTGTFTNDLKLWWAKARGKPNPLAKIGEVPPPLRPSPNTGGGDGGEGDTIWALKDVSFTVEQGEVLGIIGRNGAGKSTLLKILSRVTAPTSGKIKVKGRVASLLEVGTGFHPELTGRENIYLNGAILGMTKQEVTRKFDEIVDFAEVEQFIDTPVKRYSSGMYVRLAFAVAAHLEPEILVVDEVLAVGDAAFQKKCLGKMGDVAKEGRTVLFVSHNMAAVENICSTCILLNNGVNRLQGVVEEIVQSYLAELNKKIDIIEDTSGFSTLSLSIYGKDGLVSDIFKSGDEIFFLAKIQVKHPVKRAGFGIGITDLLGRRIVTFHSHYQYRDSWHINDVCNCSIKWSKNFLSPGTYFVVSALYDGTQMIASWEQLGGITIVANDYFGTGKILDPSHQGSVLATADWVIQTDHMNAVGQKE